ncbi:MAG: hypothetical protein LLG44_13090 [Chloroflexi bacterium]|nr:hypothetical protein [Chloroflexota bacterium]
MSKKRKTTSHHPSEQHTAQLNSAERKKQAQRELWSAVAIVALIIIGFVLFYYFTVTKPAQTPPLTVVTATPGT